MLIIRLSRVGKRSHAQYKVVLTERTNPVQGKVNEILGSYDPHLKVAALKEDRIKYWLSQGVQCSDTAHNLLVSKGLIEGKKIPVKIPKKAAPAQEAKPEAKAADEAPKVEEPKAEEPKAEAVSEAPKAEEAAPAEALAEEKKEA